MSAAPNFSPGSEVEWDRLPPAQGVQRGMVGSVVDGAIEVAYLRLSKGRVVVTAHRWFEPHEVGQLRVVTGGAR